MKLAQLRGVQFEKSTFNEELSWGWQPEFWLPYPGQAAAAERILLEVAELLGYRDSEEYNTACVQKPEEVRARLEAL